MVFRKNLMSIILFSVLAASGCGSDKGDLGCSSRYSSPDKDGSKFIRQIKRKGVSRYHLYRYGLLDHPLSENLSWGHLIVESDTGEVLSRQDLMRSNSKDSLRRTVFDYNPEDGKYLGRYEVFGEKTKKGIYKCSTKYYDAKGSFVGEREGVPKGFNYNFVAHTPEKLRDEISKVRKKADDIGISLPSVR